MWIIYFKKMLLFKIYLLFYVHWCLAFMCVCVKVSDLGVKDSCELLWECWDLNSSPLEDQSIPLTADQFVIFKILF